MTLTAQQQSETEKAVIKTVYFLELQFKSATTRLVSALSEIAWGGETWRGVGAAGEIGIIDEREGVTSSSLIFALTITDMQFLPISLSDVEEYRGKPAILYFCPLDDNFALIDTPVKCWRGSMDQMTTSASETSSRIELKCETSAYGLRRISALRHNAAQQKENHPTDTGLDYLTDLIANPQTWLSNKVQRAIQGG